MKSLCTQKKKKRSYLCLTITHHYQHCAHDKQCKQKIEESASFYRNIQRLKQRKKKQLHITRINDYLSNGYRSNP
jgi:ribosomal protein L20